MSKKGNFWIRWKGRMTETMADAAGDRHSEAKARLEAQTGQIPDDDTVDTVERKVRQRHGDTRRTRRRQR